MNAKWNLYLETERSQSMRKNDFFKVQRDDEGFDSKMSSKK